MRLTGQDAQRTQRLSGPPDEGDTKCHAIKSPTNGTSNADEHGDANNVDFADTCAEALRTQASYAEAGDYAKIEIALVRTEGNDDDGINWRGYAYVNDGELEREFSSYHGAGPNEDQPACDGGTVPQRFHTEVAKATRE